MQSVGSNDCSDGSVCSGEVLLFNQGCTDLDSEEVRKFRVGRDLALPRFCVGYLIPLSLVPAGIHVSPAAVLSDN